MAEPPQAATPAPATRSPPHYLFKVTPKAKAHWKPLCQGEGGKELRAKMTERDWAKEQICTQLDVLPEETGVSAMYLRKLALDISKETPGGLDSKDHLWYQAHETIELFKELLDEGFIANSEATQHDLDFELARFKKYFGEPLLEDYIEVVLP